MHVNSGGEAIRKLNAADRKAPDAPEGRSLGPVRRSTEPDGSTDLEASGESFWSRKAGGWIGLLLRNVGIQVPFVVDVVAPNYPPASSKRTKLAAGDTQMDDVVLGEPGATVVVELLDKSDSPVTGVAVILLAAPAGLDAKARGSWLHHRAFRQRGVTSHLGNVRFRGVPPGRIIVRVKASGGATEQRAVVSSGQELCVTLRILFRVTLRIL